jgi:hypothetical protein
MAITALRLLVPIWKVLFRLKSDPKPLCEIVLAEGEKIRKNRGGEKTIFFDKAPLQGV